MTKASSNLIKAIAVTCELTNTELSEAAKKAMADELATFSESEVLAALNRCRKELRSRLTVADVLSRIDDGRPGPEEAWAMCPRDEGTTIVWTTEMQESWGIALALIDDGDMVPARMAFIEHYRKAVNEARDQHRPIVWQVSLGTTVGGRAGVLTEAVRLGRLTMGHVAALLPHEELPENIRALIDPLAKAKALR